jgi:hypothetical protein
MPTLPRARDRLPNCEERSRDAGSRSAAAGVKFNDRVGQQPSFYAALHEGRAIETPHRGDLCPTPNASRAAQVCRPATRKKRRLSVGVVLRIWRAGCRARRPRCWRRRRRHHHRSRRWTREHNPRECRQFSHSQKSNRGRPHWLADETVGCQPVSDRNSLLAGNLQGIFAESGPGARFLRVIA